MSKTNLVEGALRLGSLGRERSIRKDVDPVLKAALALVSDAKHIGTWNYSASILEKAMNESIEAQRVKKEMYEQANGTIQENKKADIVTSIVSASRERSISPTGLPHSKEKPKSPLTNFFIHRKYRTYAGLSKPYR